MGRRIVLIGINRARTFYHPQNRTVAVMRRFELGLDRRRTYFRHNRVSVYDDDDDGYTVGADVPDQPPY